MECLGLINLKSLNSMGRTRNCDRVGLVELYLYVIIGLNSGGSFLLLIGNFQSLPV